MLKKESKRSPKTSETVKKSLIKARSVIRKKFRELHNQRLTLDHRINEEYKPIIDPLKNLVSEIKTGKNESQPKKEIKQEFDLDLFEPASVYKTAKRTNKKPHFADISGVSFVHSDDGDLENTFERKAPTPKEKIVRQIIEETSHKRKRTPHLDTLYGFRTVDGEIMLGNDAVKVKGSTPSSLKYAVGNKSFPITSGLTELLLNDNPKYYNAKDLETYKKMLSHTSAHKASFKRHGYIRKNVESEKYNKIIKTLFSSKKKVGACIEKPKMDFKVASKVGKINYTYWDDPNELVDRLRLLIASQSAGHTGHDNEIISIIEELREAKLIK